MVLHGVDVASWQAGINFVPLPADFAIIKVTGGTSYVNPNWKSQLASARAAGTRVGFYHFVRDNGQTNTTSEAEAEFFLSHVRTMIGPKDIVVMDWEGNNVADTAWAKRWLDRVAAILARKPLVYMNKSVASSYNWTAVASAGYRLWLAWYYNNDVRNGYAPPGPQPTVPYWGKPVIWQYTQNGRLLHWSHAAIDLNVAYVDLWASAVAPAVTPPTVNGNLVRIPAAGPFSQLFGVNATRLLPADHPLIVAYGNYQPYGHDGIDIACPLWTPVYADGDGYIDHAGWGKDMPNDICLKWGFSTDPALKWASGIITCIDHRNGTGSYMAHKNEALFNRGNFVRAGTRIGRSGTTGRSGGPHVHWSLVVFPMNYRDPLYNRRDPLKYMTTVTNTPVTPGAGGAPASPTGAKLLFPATATDPGIPGIYEP